MRKDVGKDANMIEIRKGQLPAAVTRQVFGFIRKVWP